MGRFQRLGRLWVWLTALSILPGLLVPAAAQTSTAAEKDAPTDNPAEWTLRISGGVLKRRDNTTMPATLSGTINYVRDLYPANVVLAPGVGPIKVEDLKIRR